MPFCSMAGVTTVFAAACMLMSDNVLAAPVTYDIDPSHTYPSFEADHMGISVWRGKFNRSKGTVVLDRASGKSRVDVEIDLESIDFGQDDLDTWAKGLDFFETSNFPQATYKGMLTGFVNGIPSKVAGELSLHGVTRPGRTEDRKLQMYFASDAQARSVWGGRVRHVRPRSIRSHSRKGRRLQNGRGVADSGRSDRGRDREGSESAINNQVFVSLATQDLPRSIAFFTYLGRNSPTRTRLA